MCSKQVKEISLQILVYKYVKRATPCKLQTSHSYIELLMRRLVIYVICLLNACWCMNSGFKMIDPEQIDYKLVQFGKANLGEGDLGEGELGEGDLGEGDLGEGDLGEGDLGEGDLGEDLSNKLDYQQDKSNEVRQKVLKHLNCLEENNFMTLLITPLLIY
ncbi:hypothetical protein FF38_12004 [Lucilia cuprina]|uniref:Uncharacterized protein n=1 Tax=Lucilia cuprina TaxID=7375 RepID=A0A0L0CFD3_LUCCU|nr:hypothetical protein FF38_12004 [Lucilia cuprina]